MATWTAEDVALAQQVITLWKHSSTTEDFHEGIDKIRTQTAKESKAKFSAEINKNFESSFQKLLLAAHGDAEGLARLLYVELQILRAAVRKESDSRYKPAANATGRRPDKWGRDAAGKLMLYFCVEKTMQEIRDGGISRPKIKDAVARLLEIPKQRQSRGSSAAKINDYASRYSEAKKILKALP